MCLLLAAAAVHDWEIKQMEVKSAFLNPVLDEEIYIKPPQGCEEGKGGVLRLLKSLYGLKQAPC